MPDLEYPKISIITPSFNQADFLEQTIRSVLDQGYPNLEYIILDGGSTDGSVEIIRKYSDRIAFWESKTDNGQADAIYRGFERATGDVIAWINSDDYYLPGAFTAVGMFFKNHPDAMWLIGNGIFVDQDGCELLKLYSPIITFEKLLFYGGAFSQPSLFMKREAFFACGGFDRTLKFSFDLDLALNLAKISPPGQIASFLSAFRCHPASKTSTIDSVRLGDDMFIRRVKYHDLTKNRLVYEMKKNFNIFMLALHRLTTSGVRNYLRYILSQKTYRKKYA